MVIIGESHNKAHTSLYGYHLPTTPKLDSLRADSLAGILIPYSDAVTGDQWTMDAIRRILTISGKKPWEESPLLPSALRKAARNIEYYDNQCIASTLTLSDYNCFSFINDSRINELSFDYRNDQQFRYDGELLSHYLPEAKNCPANSVIFFHFNGQHHTASSRYPKGDSINLFKESDYSLSTDLSDENIRDMAAYDNATKYLDENIFRIIEAYKDRDAAIVYFPDHGELVFDCDNTLGRSMREITPEYAKAVFSVPFIIYLTSTYINNHPEKAKALLSNKDKRVYIYDVGHLILDLSEISSPYLLYERSLASSKYDESRRRLINSEQIDYDELVSTSNCSK